MKKRNKTIKCPKCNKKWSIPSEQEKAIKKRGKCIACLINDKDKFDPEDFWAKQ